VAEIAWESDARIALVDGFDAPGYPAARLPTPAKRLIAFLALRERPQARDFTAFSLWSDAPDDRAAASFRNAIWKIRERAPGLLVGDTAVIGLAPDVSVDYHQLRLLAHTLADLPTGVNVQRLVDALSKDLLPEWYDDWILLARARWLELRLHALEALADRLIEEGRFMDAIDAAVAAVSIEPVRETSRRILIRAYLAEGNRGSAVKEYEKFRSFLCEELDVEPSPDLRRLARPDPAG
jgi:DNA-binding SARP family transcriptional activator